MRHTRTLISLPPRHAVGRGATSYGAPVGFGIVATRAGVTRSRHGEASGADSINPVRVVYVLTLVCTQSAWQTVPFRDRPDALLPPQELPGPRDLAPRVPGS